MNHMDDLDQHLEVLVRLRRRAAPGVYDRALLSAKVAVAKVILAEAERVACGRILAKNGVVVPFPGRRLRKDS